MGLRAWQKMTLQVLAAAGVLVYIRMLTNVSFDMRIPFSSFFTVSGTALIAAIGGIGFIAEIIVICGTVNGSNFTDGLDGLASSVTAVIAVFIAIASGMTSAGIAPAAMAFLGGLLGFLVYNHHPAKVFMGDTGSLSLGATLAAVAVLTKTEVTSLVMGGLFIAEAMSVIMQVLYFKATGGRRIFLMAPLHHHFEQKGWDETKVVMRFWIVSAALSVLGFALHFSM
jgi:phospho-N-acetylmuramoyl-pentapeptide-transferase